MKKYLTIPELDRVTKFVHELNELGKKYQVGLTSNEDIELVLDGVNTIPFALDQYDTELSLVVSL